MGPWTVDTTEQLNNNHSVLQKKSIYNKHMKTKTGRISTKCSDHWARAEGAGNGQDWGRRSNLATWGKVKYLVPFLGLYFRKILKFAQENMGQNTRTVISLMKVKTNGTSDYLPYLQSFISFFKIANLTS